MFTAAASGTGHTAEGIGGRQMDSTKNVPFTVQKKTGSSAASRPHAGGYEGAFLVIGGGIADLIPLRAQSATIRGFVIHAEEIFARSSTAGAWRCAGHTRRPCSRGARAVAARFAVPLAIRLVPLVAEIALVPAILALGAVIDLAMLPLVFRNRGRAAPPRYHDQSRQGS